MLKTVVLLYIFVETTAHFLYSLSNRKFNEKIYLSYKYFCNILNVFNVTFDLIHVLSPHKMHTHMRTHRETHTKFLLRNSDP